MTPFAAITERINAFRDALGWRPYHKKHPKELVLGIVTEAAEVAEHVRFRTGDTLKDYLTTHKDEIGEELIDTIYCCVALADDLGIDLDAALPKKLEKTMQKYSNHLPDLDELA